MLIVFLLQQWFHERVTMLRYTYIAFSFLTGAQDSHLQRVMIPEAAYVRLRRRPPEDEQTNAQNM